MIPDYTMNRGTEEMCDYVRTIPTKRTGIPPTGRQERFLNAETGGQLQWVSEKGLCLALPSSGPGMKPQKQWKNPQVSLGDSRAKKTAETKWMQATWTSEQQAKLQTWAADTSSSVVLGTRQMPLS